MAFLFFLLRDRTLRRIPVDRRTLEEITNRFIHYQDSFFGDGVMAVEFNGLYKPDEDEVLYASIELDDEFTQIPDNTLEIDIVDIPNDDVIALGLYNNGIYYFQCIVNQLVMKNGRFTLIFSNQMFKRMENKSLFTIDDKIHAIYKEQKLYFQSYILATRIFSLSGLFEEANNSCIDNIFSDEKFTGIDCEWLKANTDSKIHKQITQILKCGVLKKINPYTKKFQSEAKKAGIQQAVYISDHIIMPKNKKKCKKVLAFINQDLFNGIFTNDFFQSNSKRKIYFSIL